jgi:hypothetical protein
VHGLPYCRRLGHGWGYSRLLLLEVRSESEIFQQDLKVSWLCELESVGREDAQVSGNCMA